MLSVSHSVGYGGDVGGGTAFVWKYCRMCALEVKQGVYIFGEEGKRLHIPEKIRKTVAILVNILLLTCKLFFNCEFPFCN